MRISDEQIIYDYAKSFLTVPYKFGGDDPQGIDCSGFVIELLMAAGVWPKGKDSTALGLYQTFLNNSSYNRFDFGALVFFGKAFDAISHVAFGLNNKSMIEAGGGTNQTLTAIDASRDNAWVRIRPIGFRKDMLCSLTPHYPFLEREI